MKRFIGILVGLALVLSFAVNVAAQDDTIVEIAVGNEDFSTLVQAVIAADLVDTLSGPGPFTVFAPTNDAFAAALGELGLTAEQLLADTDLLTSVLTYHVVAGEVFSTDLTDGMRVTTVNGATFVVNLSASGASLTDSQGRTVNITAVDIDASNGVIHVLDNVILPPSQNVVEIAIDNPDFSTLVTAVSTAGLVETLSGDGPFTVFAPTNAAFAAALAELGLTAEQLLADTDLLTSILTYHVVAGKVFSGDLSDGMIVPTLNGETFTVNIGVSGVSLTDSLGRTVNVVATDIEGTNGVIHVIDNVLLPPYQSIVEIASSNPDFSTLVTALTAADLVEALSGEGPFTVFAPTNAAFNTALSELGLSLEDVVGDLDLLSSILTYHVVLGEVFSSDLTDGMVVPTLNGETFTVNIGASGVTLTDSLGRTVNVVATDIRATNGVIHVIDNVLIPTIAGPDADGDGFADGIDACPWRGNEGGLGVDNTGCPYYDADGDGFFDRDDACPWRGNEGGLGVDETGCPYYDADGDGIIDRNDACPWRANEYGQGVDETGCPVEYSDDAYSTEEPYATEDPGDTNPDPAYTEEWTGSDADWDGFPDSSDECPYRGNEGGLGVDEVGCPYYDADWDGVYDRNDSCVWRGNEYGLGVDETGCPIEASFNDDGYATEEPYVTEEPVASN